MNDVQQSHFANSAWNTPRELAEAGVETVLGADDSRIFDVVDQVFAALEEPDRDVVNAAVEALQLAMQRKRPIEQRELVETLWRAMIREAQK
jgi:hypothetical protein